MQIKDIALYLGGNKNLKLNADKFTSKKNIFEFIMYNNRLN